MCACVHTHTEAGRSSTFFAFRLMKRLIGERNEKRGRQRARVRRRRSIDRSILIDKLNKNETAESFQHLHWYIEERTWSIQWGKKSGRVRVEKNDWCAFFLSKSKQLSTLTCSFLLYYHWLLLALLLFVPSLVFLSWRTPPLVERIHSSIFVVMWYHRLISITEEVCATINRPIRCFGSDTRIGSVSVSSSVSLSLSPSKWWHLPACWDMLETRSERKKANPIDRSQPISL